MKKINFVVLYLSIIMLFYYVFSPNIYKNRLIDNIKDDKSFEKGIQNNDILCIFVSEHNKLYIIRKGDGFYDSIQLRTKLYFRNFNVSSNKNTIYKLIYTFLFATWELNLKPFLFIVILSLILTKVFINRLKRNYIFWEIDNAINYYNIVNSSSK